jgi:hypothetical protein
LNIIYFHYTLLILLLNIHWLATFRGPVISRHYWLPYRISLRLYRDRLE